MFAPDVEARFKKIEDHQVVAAELLHRFEMEAKDRIGRLEAVQDAMARWLGEMDTKMSALVDAQLRSEAAIAALSQKVDRLSDTVDRFLKSRLDGGG